MARKTRRETRTVSASQLKRHFSEVLRQATREEIVVTLRGRPTAVIIGFEDEDDWLEYCLLKDEHFQDRIAESRQQYCEGKFKRIEELTEEP